MKIGIDIDGVLTDIQIFYMDYASKYAYENNLEGIVNETGYEVEKILNCDIKYHSKFWKENLKYYKDKKYTRKFASEIINKLRKENDIYIITARREEKKEWTKNWLRDNKIEYDKLVFTKEKLKYCIENNINLMIEDDVENIKKISEIIPVFCMNNIYNKECKREKYYKML